MMKTVFILLFISLLSTVSSCPPNYNTWFDGWCLRLSYYGNLNYNNAQANCAQEGASLPSIHSSQENTQIMAAARQSYNGNFNGFYIGLKCNETTKEYYWVDGKVANYTNFKDTNQTCSESISFVIDWNGDWVEANGWSSNYIACVMPHRSASICDDFDLVSSGKTEETCLKLFSSSNTWNQAETECTNRNAHLVSIHDEGTNEYIRRSAIAQGMMNGMHIGLERDRQNANWTWSDGSEGEYDNFSPGFPDSIYGECTAMQTAFQSGKWMNVDCYNTRLPYFCSRPVFTPTTPQPSGCPTKTEYKDGDEIFSPSFPSSPGTGYCEYLLLSGQQNSRIELTIDLFESNLCCDSLQVFDGLFGQSLIANLNGFVPRGSVYRSNSNALRLVWNATSGVNVRGFNIKMKTL